LAVFAVFLTGTLGLPYLLLSFTDFASGVRFLLEHSFWMLQNNLGCDFSSPFNCTVTCPQVVSEIQLSVRETRCFVLENFSLISQNALSQSPLVARCLKMPRGLIASFFFQAP
jgi:hypothetical protein